MCAVGALTCQTYQFIKGVLNLKVAFPALNMRLMEISCSRLKQYKKSMLIPLFYVLGCSVNFWVIFGFIWEEIVFLEGSVKLGKIR